MDELNTHVLAWLHEGGWPLEYQVAREFRAAGFRAEQGRSYVDPASSKNRELDVLAIVDLMGPGYFRAMAAVECKHSTGHPWVALTSDASAGSWEPVATEAAPSPRRLQAFLRLSDPVAFSVVQTLVKGREERPEQAWSAMNQAVSAAMGTVAALTAATVVVPVVVVDAPLFVLLFEQGTERLEPRSWYRVRFHGAQAMQEPTAVDVVTRDYLPQYAARLKADFESFAADVSKKLDRPARGL